MKTRCPRCEQGWVLNTRIKTSNEEIHVCEECEAAWIKGTRITFENFVDMSSLLKAKGLNGKWAELEIIDV
jgi:NAD-dependent SIR2 family protein deacetylase